MISLKRLMDIEHTSAVLLHALRDAYAGTLHVVGESAARVGPSTDDAFEQHIGVLARQMTEANTPADIDTAGAQVRDALQAWATTAAEDLRRKTADVKELLVALADTAANVAASDAEHVVRFDGLTARLRQIATLDDVRELRSAVLDSATELRASVEVMSASTHAVLSAMQAQLDAYQAKLDAAEQLAAHDPLTGLHNRRSIEHLIARRVAEGQPFTIGLIDLDDFKQTNDRHGHAAGDDLLRQFTLDLKAHVRPGVMVGRWGGDEFIVVAGTAGEAAQGEFERLQQWVGGRYTIDGSQGTAKVHVELSVGVAQWRPGLTADGLIEEADRAMYAAKRRHKT